MWLTKPSYGCSDRTVVVKNANTSGHKGYCLEAHDLAASKLVANRPKDREFVRVLLVEGIIDPARLEGLMAMLPVSPEDQGRMLAWVSRTAEELDG